MKHYLSMTGVFQSLMLTPDKLSLEEISQGYLVFEVAHRDGISSNTAVPAFVCGYNKTKPKYYAEADYVSPQNIDQDVYDLWVKFRDVARAVEAAGRLTWDHGQNYPHLAMSLIQKGSEVFWDGEWKNIAEFKYLLDKEGQ